MDQFVFKLDSEFLETAVSEVHSLADTTIVLSKKSDVPEKFIVARDASIKMLRTQPVTQKEVTAILDVIGGYYAAMQAMVDKHGGEEDQLEHAKELMRFAETLVELVKPVWTLQVVKDQMH